MSYDQFGNPTGLIGTTTNMPTTTTGGIPQSPGFQWQPYPSSPTPPLPTLGEPPAKPDHRDREIAALRECLREAYTEIGRLHEQVRGITNFREWTERAQREAEAKDKVAP